MNESIVQKMVRGSSTAADKCERPDHANDRAAAELGVPPSEEGHAPIVVWDGRAPDDLCPQIEALYAALGARLWRSPPPEDDGRDLLASVDSISGMIMQPKLGRSAAAALCLMLGALVHNAGPACDRSRRVADAVLQKLVAVVEHVQAKHGAEATPMVHHLLAALRAASADAMLTVQAAALCAIASAVPLAALQEGGPMCAPLCAWANGSAEMQQELVEGAMPPVQQICVIQVLQGLVRWRCTICRIRSWYGGPVCAWQLR